MLGMLLPSSPHPLQPYGHNTLPRHWAALTPCKPLNSLYQSGFPINPVTLLTPLQHVSPYKLLIDIIFFLLLSLVTSYVTVLMKVSGKWNLKVSSF